MAYPVVAVVNSLLDRAEIKKINDMNPMKIQKLLFYTQAWYLKLAGVPLIDEFFSRWEHGPIIPSLYHLLKKYHSETVSDRLSDFQADAYGEVKYVYQIVKNEKIIEVLDKILDVYGQYSGYELSRMSHRKGGAWARTAKNYAISWKLMQEEV